MATVRQLTTRFNFETDKRGITKFNAALAGMKNTVLGVAAALGAGAAGTAIAGMGIGLETAAVNAARFTDEVKILEGSVKLTGAMAKSFAELKNNIPGRVALGPFLRSFAEFKQQFGDTRTIEDFNTFFETAGLIAVSTAGNVEDIFKQLATGASSGNLTPLRDVFPDFDEMDEQMQNFIRTLLNVDPTGMNNIRVTGDRFLELMRDNIGELRTFSNQIFSNTTAGQFQELGRNIKATGELIGIHLAIPMRKAAEQVNRYFDMWIDGKKSFLEVIDEISQDIKSKLAENPTMKRIIDFLDEQAGPAPGEPDSSFYGGDVLGDFTNEALRKNADKRFRGNTAGASQSARVGARAEARRRSALTGATFNITINEVGNARAVVDELDRRVGQADNSFNQIEAAVP